MPLFRGFRFYPIFELRLCLCWGLRNHGYTGCLGGETCFYPFLKVTSKKVLDRFAGSPNHATEVCCCHEDILFWIKAFFQIGRCFIECFFLYRAQYHISSSLPLLTWAGKSFTAAFWSRVDTATTKKGCHTAI